MIKVNAIMQVWEFVIKPLISEVCCCAWNFHIETEIGAVITSVYCLTEGKGVENQ